MTLQLRDPAAWVKTDFQDPAAPIRRIRPGKASGARGNGIDIRGAGGLCIFQQSKALIPAYETPYHVFKDRSLICQ